MTNALCAGTNSYIWEVVPNASQEIGPSVADMKIVMKPIETITRHTQEGIIRPIKYRIIEGDETIVVRIDKVLTRGEEKSDGCRELIFGCQGVINGYMKNFELKYRISACQWFLYRM